MASNQTLNSRIILQNYSSLPFGLPSQGFYKLSSKEPDILNLLQKTRLQGIEPYNTNYLVYIHECFSKPKSGVEDFYFESNISTDFVEPFNDDTLVEWSGGNPTASVDCKLSNYL